MSGSDQVIQYRGAIERNRVVFALQFQYAYFAFFGICEGFDRIVRRLQVGRDADGKSYVSLLPFVVLAQRQCMSAFELLATCRSYEAWISARPAIEATLIVGKWLDNPENAAIWNARGKRKTEYIKNFSGKGLISTSVGISGKLKEALDLLNDEFIHANEPYYSRHTLASHGPDESIFLEVQFFDADEDCAAHTLAFLHMSVALVDALDSALATVLTSTGPHKALSPALESELAPHFAVSRSAGPESARVLEVLGLWPNAV